MFSESWLDLEVYKLINRFAVLQARYVVDLELKRSLKPIRCAAVARHTFVCIRFFHAPVAKSSWAYVCFPVKLLTRAGDPSLVNYYF